MVKGISILGSTGSIGRNVLRVVDAFPDRFHVAGLAGGSNAELLAEQVARYRPRSVSVASKAALEALARLVDLSGIDAGFGEAGMVAVATDPRAETVVASLVGAVGLVPAYRALEAGKDLALANKETLVMAGALMVALAAAGARRILPIDSEHCALHQCLEGRSSANVARLILTASGGPFRGRPTSDLDSVTPEEALNHPTWSMGRKITIDSATLMNKGLEVIEARWLFGIQGDRIDVVIHPQSVVHSMVELRDGTLLAQLGVTDMRLPIQYALSYPEVWDAAIPRLNFTRGLALEFQAADPRHFPCLGLAYRALRAGGTLPAVMNAANEEAVASFLDRRLSFGGIPEVVAETMEAHAPVSVTCIEEVLDADSWARERARAGIERRASSRVHA
jgi:1-deoxy-D-xylulose-5-phosphate reductoisomerase